MGIFVGYWHTNSTAAVQKVKLLTGTSPSQATAKMNRFPTLTELEDCLMVINFPSHKQNSG